MILEAVSFLTDTKCVILPLEILTSVIPKSEGDKRTGPGNTCGAAALN